MHLSDSLERACDNSGRAFLHELLAALDAMPQRRLRKGALVGPYANHAQGARMGDVCALGCVAKARGVAERIDPFSGAKVVGALLNLNPWMTRAIMEMNDAGGPANETPEQRFARMRSWVSNLIRFLSKRDAPFHRDEERA